MGSENKYDKLSKFFKEKFENLSKEVPGEWDTPSDNVWANIESNLDSPKRFSRWYWLILIPGFIIGVCSVLLFQKFNQNEINPNGPLAEQVDRISSIEGSQLNSETSSSEIWKDIENQISGTDHPNLNIESFNLRISELIDEEKKATFTPGKTKLHNDLINVVEADLPLNGKNQVKSKSIIVGINDNKLYSVLPRLNLLLVSATEVLDFEANVSDLSSVKQIIQSRRNRLQIGPYFSPSYSYRSTMNINSSSGGHQHHPFIDNERPLYSHSTGIKLKFSLNGKLDLISGVNYLHTHFQSTDIVGLNYTEIGAQISHHCMHCQLFTNDFYFIVHSSFGDSEIALRLSNEVFKDGNDLEEGDEFQAEIKSELKVSSLGLPLLLEWNFLKYGNLSASLQGGLIANKIFSNELSIEVLNLPIQRMSHRETRIVDPFVNTRSYYFDYQLGVVIEYILFERMSLYVEPVYRKRIATSFENQYLKVHPYNFAAQTGFLYRF